MILQMVTGWIVPQEGLFDEPREYRFLRTAITSMACLFGVEFCIAYVAYVSLAETGIDYAKRLVRPLTYLVEHPDAWKMLVCLNVMVLVMMFLHPIHQFLSNLREAGPFKAKDNVRDSLITGDMKGPPDSTKEGGAPR